MLFVVVLKAKNSSTWSLDSSDDSELCMLSMPRIFCLSAQGILLVLKNYPIKYFLRYITDFWS